MTYAGTRRIIDVDSHLFELDDFLHSVATPEEAAVLPPVTAQSELPVSLEAMEKGRGLLEARRNDPATMKKFEDSMFDPSRSPWSRLGAFDPEDRSHALDVLGFEHQYVLATFSFHQIAHVDDPAVLEVGARVHNRAMARFCANDPRLHAIGYVPLSLGPEIAGQLIDEAFAEGVATVMLDPSEPNPEARSFTHPDFDPVWARFVAANVPFVMHIAVDGHYDPVPPSFHHNSRAQVAVGGDAPASIIGLLAMNFSLEMFLTAMIFDGVFERHEGLRCVSMERGASWVPGWLDKLDFVERATRHAAPRKRRASEVARERLRVCPFASEPVGKLIEQLGPDMLCFASDYPHPEGSADPIGKFEATMDGIDGAAREAFYAGNIETFMGLTSPGA
jgi:predicted TIM-barrel fold metal-dependent hydrolase